MNAIYTPQYYADLAESSRKSARVIVPIVLDLVRPTSVIDVGCGTGAWLSVFKDHGVTDIMGVDQHGIDPVQLEIQQDEFFASDLTQPLDVDRRFDLAVCAEVAEHLPETLAEDLVRALTRLAPVVLFSAAIPHQGGEHHVNEQWPAYWVERFAACGYAALDPYRRLLWQRPDVDWWYAQNLLMFVDQNTVANYRQRLASTEQAPGAHVILPLVHPRNYLQQAWRSRVLQAAVDLVAVVPPGKRLIVADEDRFGPLHLPERHVLPFLEHDGVFAGPPRDDEHAIAELRRMLQAGARYFAIGWPAFWWLSHYRGFANFLKQHHDLLLHNDRLALFQLRPE